MLGYACRPRRAHLDLPYHTSLCLPADRCRFLPGEFGVKGGACATRRTRAQRAPDDELSRRQDVWREKDGPAALAGTVTRGVTAGTVWRQGLGTAPAGSGLRRPSALGQRAGPVLPAARLLANPSRLRREPPPIQRDQGRTERLSRLRRIVHEQATHLTCPDQARCNAAG